MNRMRFFCSKWGIIAVLQMADKEKPAMYWIGWRWGNGSTQDSEWWLLYPLAFWWAVAGISYTCCTCVFSFRYLLASTQNSRFVFLCVSYRIIHGVGKPDEVLECIERGVDIFESFFPFQVTERGCALVFSYDCHPDPEAAGRLLDGHYNFYCISQYCGRHNSCFGGICISVFCSWNSAVTLEKLGFHYWVLLLKVGYFGVKPVEANLRPQPRIWMSD